jgi:hypothetical protein
MAGPYHICINRVNVKTIEGESVSCLCGETGAFQRALIKFLRLADSCLIFSAIFLGWRGNDIITISKSHSVRLSRKRVPLRVWEE